MECILELSENAKVRKDSIAYIAFTGFVGDTYVGLTSGSTSEFFKNGEVVTSEEPIQSRLLMKKADEIADNLDRILVGVKSIVTDNRENLDKIIDNLAITTDNFKEFSADLKAHPWKLMFKEK